MREDTEKRPTRHRMGKAQLSLHFRSSTDSELLLGTSGERQQVASNLHSWTGVSSTENTLRAGRLLEKKPSCHAAPTHANLRLPMGLAIHYCQIHFTKAVVKISVSAHREMKTLLDIMTHAGVVSTPVVFVPCVSTCVLTECCMNR